MKRIKIGGSAKIALHRAKAEASRIADTALASKGGPYIAASAILARRKTRGAQAALLAGLVVGALCERGHAAEGEALTIELNLLAEAVAGEVS